MKKLLFILALLPIGLMGQTDTTRLLTTRPDPPTKPQVDTVAVWLDCADTTARINYNVTMRGFEIKKVTGHYWGSPEPNEDGTVYAIAVEYPIWETIGYLNSFKKPLIGYLVWKTKEIEK
jgi:hypothetical protein